MLKYSIKVLLTPTVSEIRRKKRLMRHKTLAIISLDAEGATTDDLAPRQDGQNLHPRNDRLASFSDNSFDQSDFREPGKII